MSPPFASKLGTSYCPSDEETKEILGLLVEPCSHLKRLDDEISDLQKAIEKVTAERDSLNGYVEPYKALISPARRLPLDILEAIFVVCMPTHRNCVMSAHEAPVLLGRICSAWRTISFSTPRLWSRLHIAEPTPPFNRGPNNAHLASTRYTLYEEKLAERIETVGIWLRRSGQCPLSISLHRHPDPLFPYRRNTGLITQALIPFAPRWQDIRVTAPPSALKSLLDLTAHDVPMLETLEIYVSANSHDHNTHNTQSLTLLQGREITNFGLHGASLNPLTLPLRWGQLTSLSLIPRGWNSPASLSSSIILEILTRCSRLRTCTFLLNDTQDTTFDVEASRKSIELRFLHTLHITSATALSASSGIPKLFRRLVFPDLRHLDFCGCSHSDAEVPFAPLLGTSRVLESLKIDTETLTKHSLFALLHELPPTMQRLHITNLYDRSGPNLLDDDMFEVLTSSADRSASCPHLEELKITQSSGGLSDAALLRFITARMTTPSSTLKRVEIEFNRKLQVDIRPDIQPFLDAGLQVLTTYRAAVPCSPWQGLAADAPLEPWVNI
ncbi:hypothetical protein DFH09DRAFT_1288020 [Mycena vulgaris]|nr:hypothetical protein DFH09DRAFT_1288020 [Mycena vulgaris]